MSRAEILAAIASSSDEDLKDTLMRLAVTEWVEAGATQGQIHQVVDLVIEEE